LVVIRSLEQWRIDLGGEWHQAIAAVHTVTGVSTDTRTLTSGQLFLALRGPRFNGAEFVAAAASAGAVAAVVDASTAAAAAAATAGLPLIVVADVLAALQRAALAHRERFAGTVIAVAGSNGKTTVKEMLAGILAECGATLATAGNLNNHIGVPLTLLRLSAEHVHAVIEIGANHPGEVAQLVKLAKPQVAIVTNAGAEHLEGFGDIAGAARAEGELFEGLAANATAVINAEDDYAGLWRSQAARSRQVLFGFRPACDVRVENASSQIDEQGFLSGFALIAPQGRAQIELRLAGMHNILNAAGAAAAALAAGAQLEHIRAGLAKMRPVRGRLQFKRAASGAWLLDDSYNANPSSMRVAIDVLASLAGPKWFVAGAMGELGAAADSSHRELGEYARRHGVDRLLGFGEAARLTVASFGAGGQWFADIESLQQELEKSLSAEVCLLVKGSRSNRLERLIDYLVDGPNAAPQRKAG
jgi:UDP-N-acetylmuramoyl-tripeptide--D-alanyl-D-alanine ligase